MERLQIRIVRAKRAPARHDTAGRIDPALLSRRDRANLAVQNSALIAWNVDWRTRTRAG
jgi:hypothetical protein